MDRIRQGEFHVKNPFNHKVRHVDARPKAVHSIVFWSKNLGPFLSLGADRELEKRGYPLFFNLTLNSESKLLEPALPPLARRLAHARTICDRFGPETLAWRFDPICFFSVDKGQRQHNLEAFPPLADTLAGMGVKSCTTSFYGPYAKVNTRIRFLERRGQRPVEFIHVGFEERLDILCRMAGQLSQRGMELQLCCQPDLTAALEKEGIRAAPGRCIDGHRLKALFGGHPERRRDYGQRSKQGCTCTRSVDIGSYQDHPCHHNCLFCYAHTGLDLRIQQGKEK